MRSSRPARLGYRPAVLPMLVGLVVLAAVAIALVEVGVFTFAYGRLGIDRRWAYVVLVGSIVGGAINVPIARWPERLVPVDAVAHVYGVPYRVPAVRREGTTVLAVNVGGAIVPSATATYLVVHLHLWRAVLATAIVVVIVHRLARPIEGVGIVVPTLAPAIAAALAAYAVGGRATAAVAYTSGTFGALIGADLLNLRRVRGLGAPVASIGGAGTFDGIFITGILAVVLASI